jgi:ribonuclease HII
MRSSKYVVGIDEVGRGALAGPVTVAAAAIPTGLNARSKKLGKLKDSKKLTPKQREAWFSQFKNHPQIKYAVARVYPRAIEQMNISGAANLAALRAYRRLAARYPLDSNFCKVYLDGGLFLGSREKQPKNAKTIIRGDEKIEAISMASIIAKVHRDHAMVRLAKQYPRYGFDAHKGYGTKIHLRAIKKYGSSKAHRMSFGPIARMS